MYLYISQHLILLFHYRQVLRYQWMLFTVKGRMYVREGNPYLDLLTQSEAAAQNLGCHIELRKLRQSSANVALMLYQRQRR